MTTQSKSTTFHPPPRSARSTIPPQSPPSPSSRLRRSPLFPVISLPPNAEGSVSIYNVDPFVHLKTVKIHKKAINLLSVHPSGKLALTVGHDECLAMVNLVRGWRSFYCKLGKESSIVQFDQTGDNFFMCVDSKISIHEFEDGKLIMELDSEK